MEPAVGHHNVPTPSAASKGPSAVKRKRTVTPKKPAQNTAHSVIYFCKIYI